jgi:hypothetical protein
MLGDNVFSNSSNTQFYFILEETAKEAPTLIGFNAESSVFSASVDL